MTPTQFLTHIKQQEPAPAYLFLGPERYQREYCRNALIERVLPGPEDRGNGVTRMDLDETPLDTVIEDACSLSLFAANRVILVGNAEAVLPRGKAAAAEGDDADDAPAAKVSASALEAYLKNPVPGTVLVFEAAKFDFQGEDKKKIERVRKFYSAIPVTVEFAQLTAEKARAFAQNLARRAGLEVGSRELDLLVESLGGEAARIAAEIEKLRIYTAGGRQVTETDIAELVPEARESTIFALVAALGRKDRTAALEVLDTLMRQGEYLPLALAFLATQFRMALVAKEAGLRSAQQIAAHFSGAGLPMWYSRAEQVHGTASEFSAPQLAAALKTIHDADKALRDAHPDDRVVMEEFILKLTG